MARDKTSGAFWAWTAHRQVGIASERGRKANPNFRLYVDKPVGIRTGPDTPGETRRRYIMQADAGAPWTFTLTGRCGARKVKRPISSTKAPFAPI